MSIQSIAWQLMSEEDYAAFIEERSHVTPDRIDIRPSIRKTFKYNPDWSHLDEWEDADWTYTICRTGEEQLDDCDDSVKTTMIIVTSRPVTDDEIHAAFRGELAKGCSCEYDCCGHYFGGFSDAKQLSAECWSITASYSRNF